MFTRQMSPGGKIQARRSRVAPGTKADGRFAPILARSTDNRAELVDIQDTFSKAGEADFLLDILDDLEVEVIILNPAGQVVTASRTSGPEPASDDERNKLGKSYGGAALAYLSHSPCDAKRISTAIARVLTGERRETTLSYTVGEGAPDRRFRLRIYPYDAAGLRGVILVSQDVTEIDGLRRDKQRLVQQLLDSKEGERRRIAREMHDSTVQDLIGIGLTLRRLHHLANDAVAQEVLGEVRSILKRTQQDVRTLSYLLQPPELEERGLVSALTSFIKGLSSRVRFRIDFICDPAISRCRPQIEVALYRVAQEALINVHKHAGASQAVVRYQQEHDQLVLEVEDDGVGFQGGRGYEVGCGVGIAGMRSRLEELGGSLTVSSLPGGTRLKAVVPA